MYGYRDGARDIRIGKACEKKVGVVVHEIGHILGFFHEHTRTDRDQYVRINWANIIPEFYTNFNRTYEHLQDSRNSPYDYKSIMHYGSYAFAKDRSRKTIEVIQNTTATIGQRKGLSELDIQQAKLLYPCKAHESLPCLFTHQEVQSGRRVSIQIKRRRWLRCENGECHRDACHRLTVNRCGVVKEGCGDDVFTIVARNRPVGTSIYSGDEVTLKAKQTSGGPAWLRCASGKDGFPCSLGSCAVNSAGDSWSTCREAVFNVLVRNRTVSNVQSNQALLAGRRSQTPIRNNDKVALCQGTGASRRCLSCTRKLPSCQLSPCTKTDLHQCLGVFLSLRQWTNMQQTERNF